MRNILCVYYSRTGTTRAVMEKIAELLDAELVELTDGKERKGILGFVASGFDAMRRTPRALLPFTTARPLGEYEQIVLATPVWAGRSCSIIHAFLQEHGKELPERVSYVITHLGEGRYEEVYMQMDEHLKTPHFRGLSLQPKAEDRHQRIYDFVRALTDEEITEEAEPEQVDAPEMPEQMEETAVPAAQEETASEAEKTDEKGAAAAAQQDAPAGEAKQPEQPSKKTPDQTKNPPKQGGKQPQKVKKKQKSKKKSK